MLWPIYLNYHPHLLWPHWKNTAVQVEGCLFQFYKNLWLLPHSLRGSTSLWSSYAPPVLLGNPSSELQSLASLTHTWSHQEGAPLANLRIKKSHLCPFVQFRPNNQTWSCWETLWLLYLILHSQLCLAALHASDFQSNGRGKSTLWKWIQIIY